MLENRVSLFPNNSSIKRCPWGRQTTWEGNNTSNQGAIYQREVTFGALCKMFPCFCPPLFTIGLMKKKDDKYVYRKRTHSIIHHLVGVQYIYAKRNLFSYSLTMNGHLRLKYGSEHCPPVYAPELAQHAVQARTQVVLSPPQPCCSHIHSLFRLPIQSMLASTQSFLWKQLKFTRHGIMVFFSLKWYFSSWGWGEGACPPQPHTFDNV